MHEPAAAQRLTTLHIMTGPLCNCLPPVLTTLRGKLRGGLDAATRRKQDWLTRGAGTIIAQECSCQMPNSAAAGAWQ